jgi:hypothetical protein
MLSRKASPIFIVGAPRSGTTLLRFMLCSHPRIFIPHESYFIPRFFHENSNYYLSQRRAKRILNFIFHSSPFMDDWRHEIPDPELFIKNIPELTATNLLDAVYMDYANQYGAERWGDKSPTYTGYIDLLISIFPSAQFIHIIRDGRDVAMSTINAYQDSRFYVDFYYAAWTWKLRVQKAIQSAQKLDDDHYYELRYEDLITDTEQLLKDICDFLGEDYHREMAKPHEFARQLISPKNVHSSVREPVTPQKSGRWRMTMSEMDLKLVQKVAGKLLDELGYKIAETSRFNLEDWIRYFFLQIKYIILESGRYVLQFVGFFNPH